MILWYTMRGAGALGGVCTTKKSQLAWGRLGPLPCVTPGSAVHRDSHLWRPCRDPKRQQHTLNKEERAGLMGEAWWSAMWKASVGGVFRAVQAFSIPCCYNAQKKLPSVPGHYTYHLSCWETTLPCSLYIFIGKSKGPTSWKTHWGAPDLWSQSLLILLTNKNTLCTEFLVCHLTAAF